MFPVFTFCLNMRYVEDGWSNVGHHFFGLNAIKIQYKILTIGLVLNYIRFYKIENSKSLLNIFNLHTCPELLLSPILILEL
jgi:hypothetical protein